MTTDEILAQADFVGLTVTLMRDRSYGSKLWSAHLGLHTEGTRIETTKLGTTGPEALASAWEAIMGVVKEGVPKVLLTPPVEAKAEPSHLRLATDHLNDGGLE